MGNVALLRAPIAARVVEVGTFDGHGSPLAVLSIGEAEIRVPVTPEEARALAPRLYDTITVRLAVEWPASAEARHGG